MHALRFERTAAFALLCLVATYFARTTASQIPENRQTSRDLPTEVSHTQVYATADGETHYREVAVPLTPFQVPPSAPFAQSAVQPATTIRHAVFPPNWGVQDRDGNVFHNPTARRFVTARRGVMWVKVSDGETRRFEAGDVLEVLDVAPSKGHITWAGEESVVALFSNHP
jgi:hypothetical protein